MINTLKEKKEEFCQADYHTLQEAKKQLYALLTDIITDESGYVISKAIGKAKVRPAELEVGSTKVLQAQRKSSRTDLVGR